MEKGIAVCVPTYFANEMFHNCLASIFRNVEDSNRYKVIAYKNDIGWLKACNKLMLESDDDIILLNDDTILISDIVKHMSELAYSDPKIGIVGGKALNPSGEVIINYGIYLGTDGNTAHKHFGQPRNSVKVETQKAVEGSCIYIKRELIDKIGVFDEGYGMGYREELDFALRAREAGYKVISSPKAEYVHFVSQTNAQLNITNSTYDYFMSKWAKKLALGQV